MGWHLYSRRGLDTLRTKYSDLWKALDAYLADKGNEDKRNGFVYEVLRAADDKLYGWHDEPWKKTNDYEKSLFRDELKKAVEALVSTTPKTTGAAVFLPLAAGALSAVAFGFAVQHSMRSDAALEGDVVKLCKLFEEKRMKAIDGNKSVVLLLLTLFVKDPLLMADKKIEVEKKSALDVYNSMLKPFIGALFPVHTSIERREKKAANNPSKSAVQQQPQTI